MDNKGSITCRKWDFLFTMSRLVLGPTQPSMHCVLGLFVQK